MRRATPLALTAAALGLVLAACGPAPAPLDAPRPTSPDDVRYQPLDAYDTTSAENDLIGKARWTLARRCMAGLGFTDLRDLDIDPPPPWPMRPAGHGALIALTVVSGDRRYGVTDPGEAQRYGYHGARAEYARGSSRRTWSFPEYLALTGQFLDGDPRTAHGHRIPDHGCLGQASRTIQGAYPGERADPVLTLGMRALTEAHKDPAWKAADRAWSACMKTAGYSYATPLDAQNDPRRTEEDLRDRLRTGRLDDTGDAEPSAREKRTATADVRCKQRTGYVRAVHAVDVRVQDRLVARNKRQLEDQRERNEQAVREARHILDETP